MIRRFVPTVLLLLCFAFFGRADAAKQINLPAVIVFNNGIKKTVTLVEQDAENVSVLLPTGKTETYKRSDIQTIEWQLPARLSAADESLKKGQYAEALTKYDDTIAKEANAWCVEQARLRKIQCCLALGRYEDAVKEYIRILKADPTTVNLGRLPLPEGKSPENAKAAKYLKAISDLATDGLEKGMALGLAASALAADGSFAEAETYVKTMLTISNAKVQGLAKVLYGQIAVEKEDYAGAAKVITQNLKDIPDELLPAAYYWLGRAYLGHNDYDRAAIAFLRTPTYMRQDEEISADCLYYAAKTFEKADRWREAARVYADLVDNFPGGRHWTEAKETLEKLRKIGRGG